MTIKQILNLTVFMFIYGKYLTTEITKKNQRLFCCHKHKRTD